MCFILKMGLNHWNTKCNIYVEQKLKKNFIKLVVFIWDFKTFCIVVVSSKTYATWTLVMCHHYWTLDLFRKIQVNRDESSFVCRLPTKTNKILGIDFAGMRETISLNQVSDVHINVHTVTVTCTKHKIKSNGRTEKRNSLKELEV